MRAELLGYRGKPLRDPETGRIRWELTCQRCGAVIHLLMREMGDQVYMRKVTTLHERTSCVPPAGEQQRLSNLKI